MSSGRSQSERERGLGTQTRAFSSRSPEAPGGGGEGDRLGRLRVPCFAVGDNLPNLPALLPPAAS